MDTEILLKKYNVVAPRYTSYPTVPYWELEHFNNDAWLSSFKNTFVAHKSEGISLYIHLPFCENLCTYCGCNKRITKNHSVEEPYIQAVLKEWAMYIAVLGEKPKLKELHLGGGTPTFFSATNLAVLINGITAQAELVADTAFSFEAHPANTTTDHLSILYSLGFKRLSLGIQDFDPRVQFLINRFQTPEQVDEVVKAARKIGYTSINFDLIYGLPGQNLSNLGKTIAQSILLKPDRIAYYSYAHVPWLKPGQRHYSEKDIPVGNEKFALYQLGRQLFLSAGYEDVGMDHFALTSDSLYLASAAQKLHRNFMGYTDQYTHLLLGLGVSSISDSWTAFAQNAKVVETYIDKVERGILPIEKGHLLTDNDLKIRQHILNLMCSGYTIYQNGIPENIKIRLQPLLDDKLVTSNDYRVDVTEIGKSFLRNICMVFDEKLWLKQPNTQLFSSSI